MRFFEIFICFEILEIFEKFDNVENFENFENLRFFIVLIIYNYSLNLKLGKKPNF